MAEQDVLTARIQSLQEENQRLKRAVEELSLINDLARAIGASLDPQEIMGTIVRRSLRAVNAEQGVMTLVDQAANDPMKTLVRATVSSAEHEQFHLNQTLLGWMHLNKKPLLMNSPQTDERFRGVKWDETIQSLLCVPMMIKSELKGVLTIYNKKEGKSFTEEDQRLLAIIAAQSAQVVENARLNEREIQLVKMQEEVRLASRIQADLLPKESPNIPGYEISGQSIPAQMVGGDSFDFIRIDDHRVAICLGDVSGKGLPASLLMANVQATVRGQTLLNVSAKECVQRSNRLLFQSTSPEKFVTFFYGILDTENHTFCFSNAGHDNPYLLRDGKEPYRLSTGGMVLSVLEDFPYEEETVTLDPGALLVVYCDGLTEAINPLKEQFGDGRLGALINEHKNESAGDLMQSIIKAVKSHSGTAPQMDDMTLVVLRRLRK